MSPILCNLRLCFALHTSFRQKCLKLRCLQNRQCHVLCMLGKTSKCWLGLRPIWVVSHLLWCSESWCYMEVLPTLVVMWLLGQNGRRTELLLMVEWPNGKIAWEQNCLRPSCPWCHPTLGWTLGHGFIPIGCHVTAAYVLLCTPVLNINV